MRHRILNYAGWALILAGMVVLAYVGVQYVSRPSATSPHWNSSQEKKGQAVQKKLNKNENAVPVPTKSRDIAAGTDPATRLVIPKIGVDAPVVETPPVNGVWNVANWAVGHLTTTANPGAHGNIALSAHDDIMGEIFKRLDQLGPGDVVKLYTKNGVFTYVVVRQLVVDPSDVAVLNPTAKPTVTLISCTPYWVDTQRLVVQAQLQSAAAA